MNVDTLNSFVQGGCATASWAIGLFFLRFWQTSRDRLFLFFVAAFWAFSVNWIGLVVIEVNDETRHWLYIVRLIAFALMIAGIVDKNRRTKA